MSVQQRVSGFKTSELTTETRHLKSLLWRTAYRSVAEIAVREFAGRTVQEPGATPPSSGVSPGPRGDGLSGSSVKARAFRPVEKRAQRPGKYFALPVDSEYNQLA